MIALRSTVTVSQNVCFYICPTARQSAAAAEVAAAEVAAADSVSPPPNKFHTAPLETTV